MAEGLSLYVHFRSENADLLLMYSQVITSQTKFPACRSQHNHIDHVSSVINFEKLSAFAPELLS